MNLVMTPNFYLELIKFVIIISLGCVLLIHRSIIDDMILKSLK